MKVKAHQINKVTIAEVTSSDVIISNAEDALALLGELYYQGFDSIIMYQQNITEAFFDLKTGLAGEILQKFSNYRVSLIIVGDFAHYSSKSLQDFIFESNKTRQVNFVSSTEEALNRTTNT